MKKLFVILSIALISSCGSDTFEPENEVRNDDEVVTEDGDGEEPNEENDPPETQKVFTNSVAVLYQMPNGLGSDYLLSDYRQGDQQINTSEPINLSSSYPIAAGSKYRLIENNLFFWSDIALGTFEFLSYDLRNKSGIFIDNYRVVTNDELMASGYNICQFPTSDYFVTLVSNFTADGVYQNSLHIFDPSNNQIDEIALSGETGQNCDFFRYKSYENFYFHNYWKNRDNGTVDTFGWNVVNLSTKEIISTFDNPATNSTFAIYENKVIFSDGTVFDYMMDSSIDGYNFPFEMGTPNMNEAVFENEMMLTITDGLLEENRLTKGIVLYDMANQTYKAISLLKLQEKFLEFTNNEKFINDLYDVVYDFENEVIALSFLVAFPEYGVMFVDFDLNILESHLYESGSEPLDMFEVR